MVLPKMGEISLVKIRKMKLAEAYGILGLELPKREAGWRRMPAMKPVTKKKVVRRKRGRT